MSYILLGVIGLAAIVAITVFLALVFRRVVPANMVHIVQSGRKTVSYGVGGNTGNTSRIDRESRVAVADNTRQAQEAAPHSTSSSMSVE